jgi:hypothetical protein
MKWQCTHHEREDVDEVVAEEEVEVGVEVAEEEDVEEMMADAMVVAEEKAVAVAGVEVAAGVVAEGVEEEGTKAVLRYVNFKSQNSLPQSFNRLRLLILLFVKSMTRWFFRMLLLSLAAGICC